jgi:hypothetical protein
VKIRRTIYLNSRKEWRVKISHAGRVYPEYISWPKALTLIWIRPGTFPAAGISPAMVKQVYKLKVGKHCWVTSHTLITRYTNEYRVGCQYISITTMKNIYLNSQASARKFIKALENLPR